MSWKEISRMEHIFRKERGEKAIIIRLIKENNVVSEIILGMEEKNIEVTLELTVDEWNNLLAFFNSITSNFQMPRVSDTEGINEIPVSEAENSVLTEFPVEELTLSPEHIIKPTLDETPTVTIFHKSIPSVPTNEMKPIIKEFHKPPLPPTTILEPVKVEKGALIEIAEPKLKETPEAIVIEAIKPPVNDSKVEPKIIKPPEAVVIETIKPPETSAETTEIEVPTQIEIEEYETTPLSLEETGPSSKDESLYPQMPPEVKEIFDELDTQSMELEKTLLESGLEISGDESTKEAKITGAMQEVAELMPPGPAKDFVEQMIIKRKETQAPNEKTEENSNKKETKEKIEKKEEKNSFELKYW